jgi:hypothetical protein
MTRYSAFIDHIAEEYEKNGDHYTALLVKSIYHLGYCDAVNPEPATKLIKTNRTLGEYQEVPVDYQEAQND